MQPRAPVVRLVIFKVVFIFEVVFFEVVVMQHCQKIEMRKLTNWLMKSGIEQGTYDSPRLKLLKLFRHWQIQLGLDDMNDLEYVRISSM